MINEGILKLLMLLLVGQQHTEAKLMMRGRDKEVGNL